MRKISRVAETPMALLGLVWFCLMVVDLTRSLSSTGQNIATAIWIVFICDFGLRFALAPRKLAYIRHWIAPSRVIL